MEWWVLFLRESISWGSVKTVHALVGGAITRVRKGDVNFRVKVVLALGSQADLSTLPFG